MEKKRALIIASLLLAALAAAAYLAYTFWAGPAGDRPTLMYFRADL
jgi:Flp pilus assembly protein CpaB